MASDENFKSGESQPLFQQSSFDAAAFEKLFKQNFTALCGFCQYKFGFDLELAKDTVHIGFIKLWETRESISPKLSVKAYLYKIIANLSYDIIKTEKIRGRHQELHLEALAGIDDTSPYERIDFRDLTADVDRAVTELPPEMRKIFKLCRYEGLKYTEVATHLGISVKTVESQMTRAMAKLRQKLSVYLVCYELILYGILLVAATKIFFGLVGVSLHLFV
jgi:RNA polymerase sigma-70 factor (ECF subfamily)